MFDKRIVPGCWVSSRYGASICTAVHPVDDSEEIFRIEFRFRCWQAADNKETWVPQQDYSSDVTFLKFPTHLSLRVLAEATG